MYISNKNISYYFSRQNKPVYHIQSGDSVEFETMDCLSNVLQKPDDQLENSTFNKEEVNPVTGPVFIDGALPGDVLEVKIEKIALMDHAVITCQAGYGVIGEYFDKTTFRITPIDNGQIKFDSKLTIPVDPMIGVIGVAPAGDPIRSELIGKHGGNMDNTMMREGVSLFLPVQVEGALAAVGDVHAAMGDGEINCSALEAPSKVTLRFTIHKDLKINNPVLVDKDYFSIVTSEDTLDKATNVAIKEMALILKERLPIPFDDISMLMSAVGHVQICQVVNVLKTVRYLMPLYVLKTYGFTF